MNEPTFRAIKQGYPMRWEMDPDSAAGRMRLVAITYTYENGSTRQRTLYRTYSPIVACHLSETIRANGGKLEGSSPDELHARWQEEE